MKNKKHSVSIVLTHGQQEILDFIGENPGTTYKEIASSTQTPINTTRIYCHYLKKWNLITVQKQPDTPVVKVFVTDQPVINKIAAQAVPNILPQPAKKAKLQQSINACFGRLTATQKLDLTTRVLNIHRNDDPSLVVNLINDIMAL